jgi:hypothetical protein
MKKLFIFALLFAFLSSVTLAFAKPKDKDFKLNRGKLKKIEKIAEDLDDDSDDDGKGNKSEKKDEKDKDTELEKATKKTGKKLLKEAFK